MIGIAQCWVDEGEKKMLLSEMFGVERCTESIKKLENIVSTCCVSNWNGYGADPIPQNVISIVKKMLPFLNKDVEIFPTADQSIQLEVDIVGEGYFECVIQKDGSIEFFSDHASGEAPTVANDSNVPIKQPDPEPYDIGKALGWKDEQATNN